MPSDLERATARFRRSLLVQDARSRAAVQRSYRAAIASLTGELKATLAAIERIRASGGEVPTWRLLQEQRVRQLLARAEIEFASYAAKVQQTTIAAQQAAIVKAQDESIRLIEAGFGPPPPGAALPIHTLPLGAIQELTAALQPNAPVRQLLQEFAGDAVEAVQDELVGGIAAGNSPAQITRAITQRLGAEQRVRAERIVRTEGMRAYREASRATFVANKHLVEKWIWYSALGRRTCAVCWALHGKEFDVDTKMATHPNCRCVLLPKTKSWKDLGYDVPDTQQTVPLGPDLFAKLSAEDQHAILGPGAYAAYRAGDVALPDFVGITRSQVWGTGRRRVSLATAQGRAEKRDTGAPEPAKPRFATIEEAQAYAKQNVVSYGVSFKGTPPEIAVIDRIFAHVERRLPDLPQQFKDGKLFSISFDESTGTWNMAAPWQGQSLNVNSRRRTLEDWAETWDRSTAHQREHGIPWSVKSYFPRDDSIGVTIDHELGHMIYSRSMTTPQKSAIGRAVKGAQRKGWELPSAYAKTKGINDNEWFAEIFALYIRGRTELLTPEIVAVLDDVVKGGK